MTLGIGHENLSKKELDDLVDLLTDLADCDDLNDWEGGFVDDMLHRVQNYGKRTLISDAQQEQLDRMEQKYIA